MKTVPKFQVVGYIKGERKAFSEYVDNAETSNVKRFFREDLKCDLVEVKLVTGSYDNVVF